MRLALATAAPEALLEAMMARLGVEHLLEGVLPSGDVKDGKPDPSIIEATCQKFGFLPAETVMIGDAPYDVISAHAFSMDTIGVLTGVHTREELLKTGAIAVYRDLEEIQQLVSGVPVPRWAKPRYARRIDGHKQRGNVKRTLQSSTERLQCNRRLNASHAKDENLNLGSDQPGLRPGR